MCSEQCGCVSSGSSEVSIDSTLGAWNGLAGQKSGLGTFDPTAMRMCRIVCARRTLLRRWGLGLFSVFCREIQEVLCDSDTAKCGSNFPTNQLRLCKQNKFFEIKRFNSRKDHFTIMDRVILGSRCALCIVMCFYFPLASCQGC